MASASKVFIDGEADQEEEFGKFDDFTLASSWERFISEIEAICRQWLADGPKNLLEKGAVHLGYSNNLYKAKFDLKYDMKSYSMEYYFEYKYDGKIADWSSTLHDLQLSFGVKEFLVIAPKSASGVVLDAPEASKLLSAVAIAMSNCSSLLPAFVPVHDPSRKAYIGIQDMGTIFTRRFEADRISSQVPVKLMHLEGLYELFVSKFAYLSDFSVNLFKLHFTMKLTYRTISYDEEDETPLADSKITKSDGNSEENTHNRTQWDNDCPWSLWYSSENPLKGFELIAIWSEKLVESSLEMAELENASPHEAEKWILDPILSPNLISDSMRKKTIGFASQLYLLVNALDMPFEAKFMEDFVSVENSGSDNLKSSTVIPPPTVIDRVLKDIFHNEVQLPVFTKSVHKSSRFIKGAPLESLFSHFCIHVLWFGNCNIRAIALLWIEFAKEVRWCWEESQPLPKMPTNGVVDLETCLINQKLQMLAICIEKKRQLNKDYQDCIDDENSSSCQEDNQAVKNSSPVKVPKIKLDGTRDRPLIPDDLPSNAGVKTTDHLRRGSAGEFGTMMLLKTPQKMHAPLTQDAPLMTEDMHDERIRAMEESNDSFSFSAQLENEILSSDMSAFKAANPGAVFEDFIRWHSPGDWVNGDSKEMGVSNKTYSNMGLENEWPPRGQLSQRMQEGGNSWRKMWNNAPALPAYEQKPLLDANREGEKILHYLETLNPHQLLEQMVCTAFRASADTLSQTNFGGLKQMTIKMEQLYLTIASTLRPLKGKYVPDTHYSENIEDLRRLCTVFGHVEKLLMLAASLHRMFMLAPQLAEGIFSDYFNFYLPRMGMPSDGAEVQREFDKKQQVMFRDRDVVANMFTTPTSNQSWRSVISLGNLLNGHEPILREIIFSKREKASGGIHYAASKDHDQEIEMYRMYMCGTSNDLQVSLSVASCD